MFKKLVILVALSLTFRLGFSQYDDSFDDKPANKRNTSDSAAPFNIKDKLVPGSGFMLSLNTGVFFLEATPFIGYKVAEPLMVGLGGKTSVLAVQGVKKPYGVHGAQMFAQITLARQFILYGEYGVINGVYDFGPNNQRNRRWVGSPIAAIGFMNGSSSYYMVGYAFSSDYAKVNPFGNLVYRMVVYF